MTTQDEYSEEPQEQGGFDLQRYRALIGRRYMHFLIPAFVGWLAVWGASWVLPAKYTSTTTILVEEPSMPKDYVSPNVGEDLQSHLQSITQQILSRSRLLTIINKQHLYGTRGSDDARVSAMAKDIAVDVVQPAGAKQILGFAVSYSGKDPQTAQQVTSDLTDLFIDENLRTRQQESENTTRFLESQLESAHTTLADQEQKVQEYEAKHQGDLPSQQSSNIQILSGLQTQLQGEQDAFNNAKQQGIYLQSLVQQYQTVSEVHSDSGLSLPAIDQELDALRAKLADLSAHYTDHYPDLVHLKGQIAKTEKMRADLLAEMKAKNKEEAQKESGSKSQGGGDRIKNSTLLQAESQLQANHAEVANRAQAIAALKARIEQYQARLNSEPMREQELAGLTRGYEQSKMNYDELLKKKNESEMATNMEQMQQGERFRMIDPPSLPNEPSFPNRFKLAGMALGVGMALGFLVVAGVEILDDRMHDENAIKGILPGTILAEVPEILIQSDERARKRKMVAGWAAAALILSVILAGSAVNLLQGNPDSKKQGSGSAAHV